MRPEGATVRRQPQRGAPVSASSCRVRGGCVRVWGADRAAAREPRRRSWAGIRERGGDGAAALEPAAIRPRHRAHATMDRPLRADRPAAAADRRGRASAPRLRARGALDLLAARRGRRGRRGLLPRLRAVAAERGLRALVACIRRAVRARALYRRGLLRSRARAERRQLLCWDLPLPVVAGTRDGAHAVLRIPARALRQRHGPGHRARPGRSAYADAAVVGVREYAGRALYTSCPGGHGPGSAWA